MLCRLLCALGTKRIWYGASGMYRPRILKAESNVRMICAEVSISLCPSILLSFVSICLPVAVAVSHLINNLITDSDLLGVLRLVNLLQRPTSNRDIRCNTVERWRKRKFCARSLIEKRLHSASRTFPHLATVKYLNREGMQDQA